MADHATVAPRPAVRPGWMLLLAIGAISTSAPMVKLATAPAAITATYRLLFAVALMTPVVLWFNRGELRRVHARDWLACVAAGVFLAFHFVTWFASLEFTSVASSVTLVTLQPVFAFVGGYLLFHERPGWRVLAGAALSIAGGIIIGWGDFETGWRALLGDGLALTGAALATGYFLFGHSVRRRLSLNAYTYVVYGSATLTLLLFDGTRGYSLTHYPGSDWLLFLLMALLPTLAGHSVLNWCVRWVSVSVIAMTMLCEPIGASALAYWLFGQTVRPSQYLGGAVLLVGMYVFMRYQSAPELDAVG